MVLFPIIAIPDYELLVGIYQLIGKGNNTTDKLVQKSGADRRLIYGAVSILSFLGLVEKKVWGEGISIGLSLSVETFANMYWIMIFVGQY